MKPFALAEEMAFAQLSKPHKKGKGKKHHKKTKQWVDDTQPGPMDLPKDPLDEDENEAMEDAPVDNS